MKLVWKSTRKEELPSKGVGRSNYRALGTQTLRDWLYRIEYERVIAEGGDVDSIQIDLGETCSLS